MPTPILADAAHFEFTTLDHVRIDLYGALLSWSDDVQTGVVEKQVVKRAGAIHQRVGAPPRRFDFRCAMQGADVAARYRQIVKTVLAEPEGQLTHPRFGQTAAVCQSVGASESPADNKDGIEFTLKFSETGLRDPPAPSPSASASRAADRAQTARGELASTPYQAAGDTLLARATGFLAAMQAAETGLGTIFDVDASLSALVGAAQSIPADAPKAARAAAEVSVSCALQARNRYLAGQPPIVAYTVKETVSLGVLMQQLYGGQGAVQKTLALRLNRVRRPFSIPTGTELLLTDPDALASLSNQA